MATIEKRIDKSGNISFRVKIRIKGRPPVSATFQRKTDARIWAQKTESEIRAGKYFGTQESKNRTVTDMIERYFTDPKYLQRRDRDDVKRHLEWWKSNLGHYLLCDLRPALIEECKSKLLSENISNDKEKERYRKPGTVSRYLASLSSVVSRAVRAWQWMDENPVLKIEKPTEPRGRVRYLTDQERADLLKACKSVDKDYLYTVVVLALSTGARWSEIINLKWEHIDLKRRMILLDETKNGERRSIPLSGLGLELLSEMNKVRRIDTSYVFTRQDGKKPKEIRKLWEKALKKSKIPDFRFHDLRHTCASYLAMQGASLMEISAVLGHKTLAMVKRYSHIADQHTASVLERMNEKQFAGVVQQ